MSKGIVRWFNPNRKYGFIRSDTDEDVFVHASNLSDTKILLEGDIVEFDTEASDRGLSAINVKVIRE